MSNVQVKYGESAGDTAVLLLAAAEESKEFSAADVRTGSFGTFYVPEEIAKAAGVDYIADDDVDSPDQVATEPALDGDEPNRYLTPDTQESDEAPAKKTTARKTAAKKTTESQE